MNTGLRPIPVTLPVDRAAELMVRRGEAHNFHQARAIVRARQARARYGSTIVDPSDPALTAVETPRERRLPYRDD